MIYEFEHSGRVIRTHPCPSDSPTNCTFGGPKLETLFVTCGTGKVYKIDDTGHTGQLAFPMKSTQ
jgi:sugar lactone lactonase YvrE